MKKVQLSLEEWQRLAKVTPEERESALKLLRRWVSWQIIYRGFSLDYGPFSRAALGGDADDVISNECEEALFCGEWHWKPSCKLSTQLINIAKSKMGHIIEDYYERGQPEHTLTSDQSFSEEMETNLALAEQWKFEANMRDMGYEIARKAVKGHPDLEAYLDAMYKLDNYYGIASLLNTDVNTVLKLEKKLLNLLAKV